MREYPDNNPKTEFGMKKVPLDLVPPALAEGAAEAFANGAAKYGAYNWRTAKISSTVYYAAVLRHLHKWYDRVDSEDLATDSNVHHLKHAAACIGMLLDTIGSPLLNDNRPPKVVRNGNARVEGEGEGPDTAETVPGVLAYASAERDGKARTGLSRVPSRQVRGGRNKGKR